MVAVSCIEVTNLSKSFDDGPVLSGVDLTVGEGEVLAVMGPNGVGKSVLFTCLAGSTHPSGGDVTVFGVDPTDRSDTTSFLLQDALCSERLTGRENVRYFERLHPAFTDDWQRYADRLGLDALDKRVEDYSGGMTRKLELTIALAIDVPLYLLDEPTAALDLSTIQVVHQLLREKRDAGRTIVLSSHQPMDADLADRIAFVADGRVVATGTPETLFDDVPTVVETRLSNADALDDIALADEVYPADGAVRAFSPDVDGESAPAGDEPSLPSAVSLVDRPTYTDLFTYYTRVVPALR
ncbi:ABC-type multidrug transport system, ATPase component [Halovivax ruber XH-70]|uniref:ABC-type multidrug transport system, ATPase component n=1 Tax=Halovivax ruber (strain DSM 18193 / JCM 13892 / XH-70) TaxID=797302 RepID=L0IBJ3_HALRX|nr:ABC-type multidrug transport system, ATPase component [Halovivax ruber XH-70]